MNKKEWFGVLKDLTWLTQFGFSVAAPPILCLLAAGWLARRFALGGWIYAVALVLGVGAAASSFSQFLKYIRRKAQRSQKEEKH